jgi:hypothetical protein
MNKKLHALESWLTRHLMLLERSILGYSEFVLHKQKSKYYQPSDEDLGEDNVVLVRLSEFMGRVLEAVHESLGGKNLDEFMLHLGLGLYATVTRHLKTFHVSFHGGMLFVQVRSQAECGA